MAKINGIELKNVKKTRGCEGDGETATIYMDGKKIGTLEDWGDGGGMDVSINPEAVDTFNQRWESYAKEHIEYSDPDETIFLDKLLTLINLEKVFKREVKKTTKQISLIAVYRRVSFGDGVSWLEINGAYIGAKGGEEALVNKLKVKGEKIDDFKVFSSPNDFNIAVTA